MKRRPTKRSKEGLDAIKTFEANNRQCWFCGKEATANHHIVFRRGKIFDDQRNLAAVCEKCHMRIHGATLVFRMGRYDPIPLKRVLEVKRDKDLDNWDLAFLRELAGPGDGRLNMAFGEGLE